MFALDKMIYICINYAAKYIIYNYKKIRIIVFHGKRRIIAVSNIEINGKTIEVVETVVFLGNILSGNILSVILLNVTDLSGQYISF